MHTILGNVRRQILDFSKHRKGIGEDKSVGQISNPQRNSLQSSKERKKSNIYLTEKLSSFGTVKKIITNYKKYEGL